MQGEQTVPKLCFSLFELAVRLTRKSGRCEVLNFLNAVFDASFNGNGLHRQASKVEDCERLATDGTHAALRKETL